MAKKKKSKKKRKTFVPKRAFSQKENIGFKKTPDEEKKNTKTSKDSPALSKRKEFKKELKRDFFFVFVFSIILFSFYMAITQTDIFNSFLTYFNLESLY